MRGLFVLMGNATVGKTTTVKTLQKLLVEKHKENKKIKQSSLIVVGEPDPKSIGSFDNLSNFLDLFFEYKRIQKVWVQKDYEKQEKLDGIIDIILDNPFLFNIPGFDKLYNLYRHVRPTTTQEYDDYNELSKSERTSNNRVLGTLYQQMGIKDFDLHDGMTLKNGMKISVPIYYAILEKSKKLMRGLDASDRLLLMHNLQLNSLLKSDILFIDSIKELLYSGGNLTSGGISMTGLNRLSNYAAIAELLDITIVMTLNPLQSNYADQLYDIINGTTTGLFNLNNNAGYLRTSSNRLPVSNLNYFCGCVLHDSGIFGEDVDEGNDIIDSEDYSINMNRATESILKEIYQEKIQQVPNTSDIRESNVFNALHSNYGD